MVCEKVLKLERYRRETGKEGDRNRGRKRRREREKERARADFVSFLIYSVFFPSL
jgi:hypothetical protein